MKKWIAYLLFLLAPLAFAVNFPSNFPFGIVAPYFTGTALNTTNVGSTVVYGNSTQYLAFLGQPINGYQPLDLSFGLTTNPGSSTLGASHVMLNGVNSGNIVLGAADSTTPYSIKFPPNQCAANQLWQWDGAGNGACISTVQSATNSTNSATTSVSNNASYFLALLASNSSSNQGIDVGPATYNPSTGVLTAGAFSGNIGVTSKADASTYFFTFVAANSSSNQGVDVGPASYNPSTNAISATTFVGALSGNATTATTATSATNATNAANVNTTVVTTSATQYIHFSAPPSGNQPIDLNYGLTVSPGQSMIGATSIMLNGVNSGGVVLSAAPTTTPYTMRFPGNKCSSNNVWIWDSAGNASCTGTVNDTSNVETTNVSGSAASNFLTFVGSPANGSQPIDLAYGLTATPLNGELGATAISLYGSTTQAVRLKASSFSTAHDVFLPPTPCGNTQSWQDDGTGHMSCYTPSTGGGGTTASVPITTLNNIGVSTSYTLVASDATGNASGTQPMLWNGSTTISTTITVPTNASVPIPIGGRVDILQSGTGDISWTPAAGVTINQDGTSVDAQFDMASLLKTATNTWIAFGEIGGFISLSGNSPTCVTSGNFTMCGYTATGTNTVTVSGGPQQISAMVIGAGGGPDGAVAGQSGSGGAGGGDVFCAGNGASTTCTPNIFVVNGQSISMTIGTGGTGGTNAGGHGNKGGNSSIVLSTTYTANGGGYGSSGSRAPTTGGSGGGGDASAFATGASGTGTNVNSGGNGVGSLTSGGGGGAGSAGSNGGATTGGNGGNGLDFTMCGLSVASTLGGSYSPAVSAGGGGDNFGGATALGGTGGSSGSGGSGGTVGNGGLGQPGVTYGSGGGGGFANATNSNASGSGKQGAIVLCYRSS